jgi:hypothetical protein
MSQEISFGFSTARALIQTQHEELRRQLRTAVLLAGAAARRDQGCIEELPNLIDSLLAKFSEHLIFEEATLVPLLRQGDTVDRAHAERLAKEHNHQRKELQVLLTLARSRCESQTVALSFQNLLNDLIADMASEERWLTQVGTDGGLKPSPLPSPSTCTASSFRCWARTAPPLNRSNGRTPPTCPLAAGPRSSAGTKVGPECGYSTATSSITPRPE